MNAERIKKCLIIPHWDVDGICSAALLLDALLEYSELSVHVPEIGNYRLGPDELEAISAEAYDLIAIADLALVKGEIQRIKARTGSEIRIFDHHLGECIEGVVHNNPIIKGADAAEYPSTTWVIKEHFRMPLNLLVIFGVVGDHEANANHLKCYHALVQYLNERGLSVADVVRITHLIDSNYKLRDCDAVMRAVHYLSTHANEPEKLLKMTEWLENLKHLQREIDAQLRDVPKAREGLVMHRIDTRYNIISTVARELAWHWDCEGVIVVNTGFFDEADQIYVRSHSGLNLARIIEYAKCEGYVAGGKAEVLGAVVPKTGTDGFLAKLTSMLCSSVTAGGVC